MHLKRAADACPAHTVCDMQEDKFAKKALQLLGTAAQDGTLANMTSSLTPAPDRNKGKFLFDLVSCHHCTTAAQPYKGHMPRDLHAAACNA